MTTTHVLGDLEDRLLAGEGGTQADVERILSCSDLISVGVVGEQARRRVSGNRVTFCRVLEVIDAPPPDPGSAREVRLVARPSSTDEAVDRARDVVAAAVGRPVTAYTLADLVTVSAGDRQRLTTLAAALADLGVRSLSAVDLDESVSDAELIDQVRAVMAGGLGAWRVTVNRAGDAAARLRVIERAWALQRAVGTIRAFAPLARLDPSDTPATGFDDIRTVAAARVRCLDVRHLQVDWGLYGPKLAQVAVTFGANDIDGVSPYDAPDLGPRRSPLEDIVRQIRAAGGEPVERDGAYAEA